jgi:hypothetical protein
LEEFLRRWEDLPELKNAELIDGVVYVPSPVSVDHNSTWLMSGSATQPDAYLRILPSHGGQSGNEGPLRAGAPEFAVEVCVTSGHRQFAERLAELR